CGLGVALAASLATRAHRAQATGLVGQAGAFFTGRRIAGTLAVITTGAVQTGVVTDKGQRSLDIPLTAGESRITADRSATSLARRAAGVGAAGTALLVLIADLLSM